jgi:hypothetical protein
LITGTDRSAIGTLVECTTGFTMLLHLPRLDGYGVEPALTGYGAVAMRDALTASFAHEARAATWIVHLDRGKELAQFGRQKIDTGLALLVRTLPLVSLGDDEPVASGEETTVATSDVPAAMGCASDGARVAAPVRGRGAGRVGWSSAIRRCRRCSMTGRR